MKSYAFKLLMETTLFYNIRYLNIRLITNQDERIYDFQTENMFICPITKRTFS